VEKPTLIFIHIPKTGGSTMGIVLGRQYPKRVLWRFKPHRRDELVAAYKALPERERQKYRILKGHVPYGMHEWTGRPTTYITMLRNPIEHVTSYYYYALRRPTSAIYKELNENNISLEEFARSPMADGWENLQTRLLCGSAVPDAWDNSKPVRREMLDAAKANIERDFTCLGLTERFDESLLLMKRLLGWQNVTYVKRRVTEKRPRGKDIPAGAIEAIRQRTELDAELYDFVRQRFEEQLKSIGGISAEELEAFREANQRFSRYWGAVQAPWLALLHQGRLFRDRFLPQLKRR
jgi:hypothetical protein